MKDQFAFYSAVVVFLGNLVVLIIQVIKLVKLKKELSRTTRIYNIADLKKSLEKPFEGAWKVSGIFEIYHGNKVEHRSSGFAIFLWDEIESNYDVYYTYSTRKNYDNIDLVTAICTGKAYDLNHGKKIKLSMKIDNRTTLDQINTNSQSFNFISKKIVTINNRITEIKFLFDAGNGYTRGEIRFER